MVHDEVTAAADELCQRLTLLTTTARPDCPRWFRARRGPHYIKVELYEQRLPGADAEPSTFCFIARRASPFDWSNYRAGDVMVRSPRNPITRSGVSDHLTGGRGAADVGGLLTP
jgi:hypothetical protein